MLGEGRGGMIDFSKYREQLTNIMWHGKTPETVPGEKGEPAGPPPDSVLEEARAMYEASKQRLAAEKN